MRLLVPTRICLALRKVTTHPVSGSAAVKRSYKQHSKPSAAAAAPTTYESLQQLWDLSKLSSGEIDTLAKRRMEEIKKGALSKAADYCFDTIIKKLSDINDFASIEKLLTAYTGCKQDKVFNEKLVIEVLWAAVSAKSLGALPPSILDWIDEAVRQLPEPIPVMKEQIIWLLSIIRGDLTMLQQLQRESSSKAGRVGPEIEKEKIVRYAALTYLDAGKKEEFTSLWTSSCSPILRGEYVPEYSARMHHALLRQEKSEKADPAMLRWYADTLAVHQRTPIEQKPHFETMIRPVTGFLGGEIEKWGIDDKRTMKLRKWRDDYDDSELNTLLLSMLEHMRHEIVNEKRGSLEDLRRLENMLARLGENDGRTKRNTVIVDWLNLKAARETRFWSLRVDKLLPSHSLIIVGREKISPDDSTPRTPDENNRIKVMEVQAKREKKQEMDDMCSMILSVATRGHLLTNDRVGSHLEGFAWFLKNKSSNVTQLNLLSNYLNDAVLRIGNTIQLVDHSKAAQWIDNEKKELAFTVARMP